MAIRYLVLPPRHMLAPAWRCSRFIKPLRDLGQIGLRRDLDRGGHPWALPCLFATTHAHNAGEVERKLSNLMALFAQSRSLRRGRRTRKRGLGEPAHKRLHKSVALGADDAAIKGLHEGANRPDFEVPPKIKLPSRPLPRCEPSEQKR
jgi:hypothetical protein